MKRVCILFLLLILPLQAVAVANECYGEHRLGHLLDHDVSMQAGDTVVPETMLDHNSCASCQLFSMPVARMEASDWPARITSATLIASAGEQFSSADLELHDPPPRSGSH